MAVDPRLALMGADPSGPANAFMISRDNARAGVFQEQKMAADAAKSAAEARSAKLGQLANFAFRVAREPIQTRGPLLEQAKMAAISLYGNDPQVTQILSQVTPENVEGYASALVSIKDQLDAGKTDADIANVYNTMSNRDRNTSSMIGDRAARTGIYGSSVMNANANRDAATSLARERQVRSGWGQAPEGYVVDPGTGAGAPIPNVPVAGAPGQPGSGILKPKDYPTAVINAEQSDADAIQTASQLEADTGAWLQRLNSGAIDLGGPQNLASYAMNAVGLGTPETADYQELKAFATRLVNESLRLNKGVQTEGDAQRAANEMLGNLNSPAVVIRQMQVLNLLNRRAVQVRAQAFKERRSRYGLPEFDPMGVTGGMQSSPYAAEPPPAEEMYDYDANGDRLY